MIIHGDDWNNLRLVWSVGTWTTCNEENSVLSAYFSINECDGTCYWSWDIDVFIGPADPCFTECPDSVIQWENTIKDQCRHILNKIFLFWFGFVDQQWYFSVSFFSELWN